MTSKKVNILLILFGLLLSFFAGTFFPLDLDKGKNTVSEASESSDENTIEILMEPFITQQEALSGVSGVVTEIEKGKYSAVFGADEYEIDIYYNAKGEPVNANFKEFLTDQVESEVIE